MRLLSKVALLVTVMAVALRVPIAFAAKATKPATAADNEAAFKNGGQKSAYALGASLGCYMENSLKEQEELGIKPDKDQLIAGVQDAFADRSKFSSQEIEQILQALETRVRSSTQAKMEKGTTDNEAEGREYREKLTKKKGVKTSSAGLVYQVVEASKGEAPKDSDTVVVNYKDTLIDGEGLDNSYIHDEPLSFHLDGVIPGWTGDLKNIKEDGKTRLIIPLELVYGKAGIPGIPPNSTLVFDVELLDMKPAPKTDAKSEANAKATDSAKKQVLGTVA